MERMKSHSSLNFLFSILFITALLFHHPPLIQAKRTSPVPALLAFGDSIFDPGNNNNIITVSKCNFPPYGRDFVDHKPTGRWSDGKIPTDLIASKLGLKELLPAYSDHKLEAKDLLTGVSFASGGTGLDLFTAQSLSVLSMARQTEMFEEYRRKLGSIVGEENATKVISESLFLVCVGSNDVAMYYTNPFRGLEHTPSSYANFLMQSASTFLKELIRLGARKIGVLGIPSVGCTPSQRTLFGGISRECASEENKLAEMYNVLLYKELESLSLQFQDILLVYLDIYTSLQDVILNHQKYGFEEASKGCCGTGTIEFGLTCNSLTTRTCSNASKYVFWDSFHPTQKAYQILVDQLYDKYIKNIYEG